MSDFSHIQNDSLRAVLEGRIAPMTNTLGGCVDITADAMLEDSSDPLIPYSVLDARHDAAVEAADAYHDGDNDRCLAALRRYWSV